MTVDKYMEWLTQNNTTLRALYEAFQVESGDQDTSLDEFCRYLYGESRPDTATTTT